MFSLLRKLLPTRAPARARPCPARRSLQVERLEDRCVPSVLAGSTLVNPQPVQLDWTDNDVLSVTASARNGIHVVVWRDDDGQTATPPFLRAQVFNADGTRRGGVVPAAASLIGSPAVTMDNAGNWVVAWPGKSARGDADVYARRFSPDGQPLTGVLTVGTSTAEEGAPSVACDQYGAFVVAYTKGQNNGDIMARTYTASGALVGTMAVAATSAREAGPAVARGVGADGGFSIAYYSGTKVHLNRYNAAASLLTHQVIGSSGARLGDQLAVARDFAGDTVVAWTYFNNSAWNIRARTVTYKAALEAVVTVADGTYTIASVTLAKGTYLTWPSVAMDRADGDYVVAYVADMFEDQRGGAGDTTGTITFHAAEVSAAGVVRGRYYVGQAGTYNDPGDDPSRGLSGYTSVGISDADRYVISFNVRNNNYTGNVYKRFGTL